MYVCIMFERSDILMNVGDVVATITKPLLVEEAEFKEMKKKKLVEEDFAVGVDLGPKSKL